MVKQLIFVLYFYCCAVAARSQPVIFINAGSRAMWGNNQELTINASGQCRYYLRAVNGPVKDSSFFSITTQQLDTIFRKAEQSGFFSLNNKYDGRATDGAGIYISMNDSGRKHSVQLANSDVPAINELVTMLNNMLAPQRIRINYGQFVTGQR